MSAVERYEALNPREFPFLRRVVVEERGGPSGPDVVVTLRFSRHGDHDSDPVLVVRCAGVRELVFRQPWTSDMQVRVLEVEDHRDAQMEHVKYRVHDPEQSDVVSFWSRTFEAELTAVAEAP